MKALLHLSILGMVAVTTTSYKKAVPVNSFAATKFTYLVVVVKSKYEMYIYDSSGEAIVIYPVVFGNKDLSDKMMQGDRKTPEGIFHITCKRKHEKWSVFMNIDYPNAESYQKFYQRKTNGEIPADAKIGGDIGIHGTWPNEDFTIDLYQNWTEGCISTKNLYVQELFSLLPVGTKVEIRR